MENKNTYTGRFGDEMAARPAKEAAPRKAAAAAERKPSGFSTAGQAPKRSAAKPVTEEKPPKKKQKIKKEKTKRVKKQRKFGFKQALVTGLIVVLIALILLVVFGDRGTYHQMPTITREEAEGSFAPEETPLPGVEEAI